MLTRRKFMTVSAAACASASYRRAAAKSTMPPCIYIGTGTSGAGNGILAATWDAETGAIGTPEIAAEVASPTFLAQHRQGSQTFLYAVSEVSSPDAMVSAFVTQSGTAKLKLVNQVKAGGSGPTHLSVTQDGRTILVANYGGGSSSSFHVKPDGSLSENVSHFQYQGSGPYKGRQEAPHTHSALPSPDGKFALVNDLGLDRIMVYHLDRNTSALTPADPPYWSGRPGTGPRHMAWHPDGDVVYCTNELDSTVEVLGWDKERGRLSSRQFISSLPNGFPPNTAFVGEVVASRDGKNVYAGNRVADDTIAVFDVQAGNNKTLVSSQFADSGGKNSRHIALDPSQRWMVVSHQNSNDLTVLRRDPANGKLSAPVHQVAVKKPMCVVFV